MAQVTELKTYAKPGINWGKWFLIGTGALLSALILVVPMVYIFVHAFSKGLMRCCKTWPTRTCFTPSG
ncbi:sulfate ABC transporter, permease protein [Atlantibacter hermannii]|nr:sulfate ABC transporter, permease protein [Atlantibacter hermannii]